MRRPVVLIILDGWGVAPPSRRNAITSANTPAFDSFVLEYPTVTLQAAGEAVGLPWGEQGNSEVGHSNIGAGRIVYQDLQKINRTISDGSFFSNSAFLKAAEHVRKFSSSLHLIGLLSNGGVHSAMDHLFALIDFAERQRIPQVWIHGILDGRDSPYNNGVTLVRAVQERIKHNPQIILASLIGRFFAMDRDRHWDRTEHAYRLIAEGNGSVTGDVLSAVEEQYRLGIFDEFMPAIVQKGYEGLRQEDAMLFFNFRADRARQLTKSFVLFDFSQFERDHLPALFVTMTNYEKGLPVEVAFPLTTVPNTLCEVIAEAGIKQLHIAETEKYAHVTYFLNGGREEPFEGQENVLIPSHTVASYDAVHEMRAPEITQRVVEALQKGDFGFIAVNFANVDMVAHTGNFEATVKAIEVLDQCLQDIVESALAHDGVVIITADHGNAEELVKAQTGEIDKEHSDSPVPCIVIGKEFRKALSDVSGKPDLSLLVPSGVLADVAPSILKIMELPKLKEMTGRSLV